MTIDLKYKPSDDIWFMHENKPRQGMIDKVDIKIERVEKITIRYSIFSVPNTHFSEFELFSSKEELIKSL